MISQFDDSFFKELLLPNMKASDGLTFPKIIDNMANLGEDLTRKLLLRYINRMDDSFRYSKDRLRSYYVKDKRNRTIVTMLGEISYSRTIYKNRYTGKCYCYVDEKLGISKYIKYTNDVGATVMDLNADLNSMIKVGKEVGKQIHSKFSLEDTSKYAIPRQSVFNIIHRAKPVKVLPKVIEKIKINDIYVLLDEKYIPCQDKLDDSKTRKDIMTKSCLIVEGLDTSNSKRHKYINPHYLTLVGKDIVKEIEDYLFTKYDMDYLKRLHILSDGGAWIKGVYNDLVIDREKKIKYLCKFHTFKALWDIYPDDNVYSLLLETLLKGKKEELLKTIDDLIEINDSRKDVMLANKKYISNNYIAIKNMLNLKDMNCAMEQVISHHIASIFTSVPKAYSSKNINLYLSFRDSYRNGENIKILYCLSLDCKENVFILNKNHIDQSIFINNIVHNEPYAKTPIRGREIDNEYDFNTGQ